MFGLKENLRKLLSVMPCVIGMAFALQLVSLAFPPSYFMAWCASGSLFARETLLISLTSMGGMLAGSAIAWLFDRQADPHAVMVTALGSLAGMLIWHVPPAPNLILVAPTATGLWMALSMLPGMVAGHGLALIALNLWPKYVKLNAGCERIRL
jgi:hypothetical protein